MSDTFTMRKNPPRLNPTERLRHRFYEPLLLLWVLNRRTNLLEAQPITPLASGRSGFQTDWIRFLDALSFFGDFDHGGATTTSVAAEVSEGGEIKYWATSRKESSSNRIGWLVERLAGISTMSPEDTILRGREILTHSIRASRDKIKTYLQRLEYHYEKASNETPPHMEDASNIIGDSIMHFLSLKDNHIALCQASLRFPHEAELTRLIASTTSAHKHSFWGMVRHYIHRLGMWHRKSRVLVIFARQYAEFVDGASCEWLSLPETVRYPERDEKTNLWSVLGRMLPAGSEEQKADLYSRLIALRVYNISDNFIKVYSDRNTKLPVHSEVHLAEHFYFNRLQFVGNIKYIGCSKPSCYCCSLYLRYHPANYVLRPCHGNAWGRWSPPLMSVQDDPVKAKHNLNILNNMIAHIRRDVFEQIERRLPRLSVGRDSSSGPSHMLFENLSLE